MKIKKTVLLTSILLINGISFLANAAENTSSYTCSDNEVQMYITNSNEVDRAKLSEMSYKDMQAALITLQQKKVDLGIAKSDENCFAAMVDGFDLGAMQDKIFELMDSLDLASFSGISFAALFEQAKKYIYEDLRKSICKRAPELKKEIIDSAKDALDKKRKAYENKFQESALGMLNSDSAFDDWMNDNLDYKFSDSKNILEWRNGVEGGLELSTDNDDWKNTINDLFD